MAKTDDNFSFGYWLRRQRLARDLRQGDLAAQLGVATVTLRKLEADERRPSLQLISRVAEVFALSEAERELLRRVARADLGPAALPLPERAADEAPALITRAQPTTNLPAQPTALIGRAQEVAAIVTLLRRAAVRLVTLSGPGGVGKTRLGLQVAAELIGDFADGVYFVDLAPIREPSQAASAITAALGVRESAGQPLLATLKAYLQHKRLLLLLDNFEHLLDAAVLVAELLQAAAQLKVLVTSRALLHLRGEKELVVQPLALPEQGRLPACEQLSQYGAVALFIERAHDARLDFEVTNANAPAVAEICARLDGLPLAIELAAARLKLLTPEALLARLSSRLPVLTGGPRDLPARQQTIRSTIDWSYDLLSEAEQTLFRRLGVFVGGCTLQAAEAVGDLGMTTLDLLSGLIDKSLVSQTIDVGGEPRYTMLETIHEYALEQLEISGEADATRERHVHYFLELAERARPEEFGPRATFWLDRLDEEHANLREALGLAFSSGWYDMAARYTTALGWFCYYRSYFAEIAAWMAASYEHRSALAPQTRAAFTRECGWHLPGPVQRAQAAAESVALYQELGDRYGLAWALAYYAGQRFHDSDIDAARALVEQCMPLAREFDAPPLLLQALYVSGNVQTCDGAVEDARQTFAEGLVIARQIGDQHAESDMRYSLGDLANISGDYPEAEAHFHASALLRGAMDDRRGRAVQLINAARAACRQGAYARGLPLLAESVQIFRDIGWPMGVGQSHDTLAWLANCAGQPEQAARFLGAEEMFRIVVDYTIWPTTRAEYERIVSDIRAVLSDAAFAAAWAAGRALSVEAATEEALAWLTATHDQLRLASTPETGQGTAETP